MALLRPQNCGPSQCNLFNIRSKCLIVISFNFKLTCKVKPRRSEWYSVTCLDKITMTQYIKKLIRDTNLWSFTRFRFLSWFFALFIFLPLSISSLEIFVFLKNKYYLINRLNLGNMQIFSKQNLPRCLRRSTYFVRSQNSIFTSLSNHCHISIRRKWFQTEVSAFKV